MARADKESVAKGGAGRRAAKMSPKAARPAAGALSFRSPETVLRARSIAIVGASERGNWPVQIIRNLKERDYPGRVYFVNPRQKEVFGERCYPSLAALPKAPDHAAIIVPSAAVPDVLEDARSAGVKSATIYAAGLGDGDDPKSKERGAWLKGFIARSGMRICGPNCMGSFSYRERLFAYPNAQLCALPPGPVGLVFQSGGTLQFYMQSAADRGLRFSYAVSSGNEPDLDLADYVNFLVDDPETHTIVLFIEGLRRPEAFMHAAARALAASKPILAIKTGQSHGAAAAAQSHTGAIAGDYAAFLAMCDRLGITVCRSLDDLVETALAFQSRRWPKGPRIGWVTTSGGTVDLLYDYMERENGVLATFSEATRSALLPVMQEGILPKNPLDVGLPSNNEAAANWCRIVLEDDNVDMVGWAAQLPKKGTGIGDVAPLKRLLDITDKPILGFGRMVHQMSAEMQAAMDAAGFPYLQGLEPTIRAMNALWFYAQRHGKAPALSAPPKPSKLTPQTLNQKLAAYGIAQPPSRVARTPDEAAAASLEIVFPVAVKIQSADILHKTEAGGVVLDLRSPEAVELAAMQLAEAAREAYPNARIDGFLVQEMVSGIEAIVGARTDDQYGPMLLAGSGGVLVELARDSALELLPVDSARITSMVDRLRLARLLSGFRGKPPADRAAFEATIAAVGRFYLDHRSVIGDIEINPLMVRPDGHGAIAVDVRVIWRE